MFPPFVVNAIPTYLHGNSSAPGVQGVGDINSAILSTRILPLEWVLPLFLIILAFALFSKRYSGRFFTLPTLLLSMWLFVPSIFDAGLPVRIHYRLQPISLFHYFSDNNFHSRLDQSWCRVLCRRSQNLPLFTSQTQKSKKDLNKRVVWLSTHLTNRACLQLVFFCFSYCFLS